MAADVRPSVGAIRRLLEDKLDASAREFLFDAATEALDANLALTDEQVVRLLQWFAEKSREVGLRSVQRHKAEVVERIEARIHQLTDDCALLGTDFRPLVGLWWAAFDLSQRHLDHSAIAAGIAKRYGADRAAVYREQAKDFCAAMAARQAMPSDAGQLTRVAWMRAASGVTH